MYPPQKPTLPSEMTRHNVEMRTDALHDQNARRPAQRHRNPAGLHGGGAIAKSGFKRPLRQGVCHAKAERALGCGGEGDVRDGGRHLGDTKKRGQERRPLVQFAARNLGCDVNPRRSDIGAHIRFDRTVGTGDGPLGHYAVSAGGGDVECHFRSKIPRLYGLGRGETRHQ